jgi:hypothetical protein
MLSDEVLVGDLTCSELVSVLGGDCWEATGDGPTGIIGQLLHDNIVEALGESTTLRRSVMPLLVERAPLACGHPSSHSG